MDVTNSEYVMNESMRLINDVREGTVNTTVAKHINGALTNMIKQQMLNHQKERFTIMVQGNSQRVMEAPPEAPALEDLSASKTKKKKSR